jgi:isopenicillin N synthase-like dioxygenase
MRLPDSVPAGCTRLSVHCPYHTDVGLVTIIPKASGSSRAGLHVWDYKYSQWLDVEGQGSPDDVAVVLVGETLTHLTNGELLGGLHEVSVLSEGDRFSCPFQYLGKAQTLLRTTPDSTGSGTETVKQFVNRISSSRISSNFPREFVLEKLAPHV